MLRMRDPVGAQIPFHVMRLRQSSEVMGIKAVRMHESPQRWELGLEWPTAFAEMSVISFEHMTA